MFEVNFPESIGFVSTYLTRAWDAYMRGDDESVMYQWFDDTLLDIVTLAVKASANTEGAVRVSDAQLYRRAADGGLS